jgi:hypothetical protein
MIDDGRTRCRYQAIDGTHNRVGKKRTNIWEEFTVRERGMEESLSQDDSFG